MKKLSAVLLVSLAIFLSIYGERKINAEEEFGLKNTNNDALFEVDKRELSEKLQHNNVLSNSESTFDRDYDKEKDNSLSKVESDLSLEIKNSLQKEKIASAQIIENRFIISCDRISEEYFDLSKIENVANNIYSHDPLEKIEAIKIISAIGNDSAINRLKDTLYQPEHDLIKAEIIKQVDWGNDNEFLVNFISSEISKESSDNFLLNIALSRTTEIGLHAGTKHSLRDLFSNSFYDGWIKNRESLQYIVDFFSEIGDKGSLRSLLSNPIIIDDEEAQRIIENELSLLGE